jgi:PEP-CTERM motif
MKKSILIAVLGVAACAATSYGQGYVVMNSYSANAGAGAITTLGGTPVSSAWTAELYFALGTVSDSAGVGLPGAGFTALPSSITSYDANNDGYFQNATPVVIPGYSSGAISFEILASGGSLYRSGAFTESKIGTDPASPPSVFGDNGTGMPNMVIPVPEPTTLALAGLGGLASLVAMRRKQS